MSEVARLSRLDTSAEGYVQLRAWARVGVRVRVRVRVVKMGKRRREKKKKMKKKSRRWMC